MGVAGAPWCAGVALFLICVGVEFVVAVPAGAARSNRSVEEFGGDDYGELVTIGIPDAGKLTLIYMTDPEGNIVELQKWHHDSEG